LQVIAARYLLDENRCILNAMDRAGRIAAIIILLGGLLFVIDVISPATPIPQAVQDGVSVVFGVLLLIAAVMRPLFRSISPPLRFTASAIALCADHPIGMRAPVLLC